ncbi:MAG: DnaA/Hda family protein [Alphaproteobacteria bacterium]|nr:DnaA/Hda family protein [Alphaproteobacteria bacterium]
MTMVEDEELKQIPFDFVLRTYMGREDFMVAPCNCEAFHLVDSWPKWLAQGMIIYGPKGCGKSHLAHLFADKVKIFSDKPIKISLIDAGRINLRNVNKIASENQSIVIENLTPRVNAEALFHLFNIFNTEGRYMLWTAETAPSRMSFALKDLQSRLNMLPSVEIKEPDDLMLQTLIVKLFNDRQILISPEVLNFIVANAPRSFEYIGKLVEECDNISLAYQCAVNYNVVKKAMELLAQTDSRQPDLFDGLF